ncbi:MAG: sodium ion-translocating decarboxylase subunit beta [Deltaproteobacteria bacterium]|nr:sodium ion-translocating decarboxylase subunit beta [Deltaproteobacteria bacterium]MBW2306671.1 sodium ion-translocating decarboxylase subunit beta [Deltaproteobacteria bacterium]
MIREFISQIGFVNITPGEILMVLIGGCFIFLAIKKEFEPFLLLPIGFGIVLTNLPLAGLMEEDGILGIIFKYGVEWEILPLLIFMGVGALTDFGPLIANPKTFIIGAGAQVGIPVVMLIALFFGFSLNEASSIGLIGTADGPIIIYAASKLAPQMIGIIGLVGYSYMALIPLIQPPIIRLLTTHDERAMTMKQLRPVSREEKIFFPILTSLIIILFVPKAAAIISMLMIGNLFREAGVVQRLANSASNEILNVSTIFLGLTVGATMSADVFLRPTTLLIFLLGLVCFAFCTATGILTAKILNLFCKEKVNPLLGSAGVSAVPMAARVAQLMGQKANRKNFLLMHAMGPNVSGVVASSVIMGIFITILVT